MVAATELCAEELCPEERYPEKRCPDEFCDAAAGDALLPCTAPVPLVVSRVVAVAVTPKDLLRPGSELARAAGLAGPVDLLLACADEPVARLDAADDDGPDDVALLAVRLGD